MELDRRQQQLLSNPDIPVDEIASFLKAETAKKRANATGTPMFLEAALLTLWIWLYEGNDGECIK